jgi:hypothetical protein
LEVLESRLVIDREAKQHSVGRSEENFGHGAEVLLACGVPNMQFAKTIFNANKE